jgi:hypothetical protein
MRLKLEHDLPYLITGKGTKRAIASPEECWPSNWSLPRLADHFLMTIEYHIKGLAKKLISLG